MIGRSFTSLDVVFDIIRITGTLGKVIPARLESLKKDRKLDQTWTADINCHRSKEYYGSGTIAFWLPENVNVEILNEGFDSTATKLGTEFYTRLERVEFHYATFFDIPRRVFDADVLDEERDVRDWKMEDA